MTDFVKEVKSMKMKSLLLVIALLGAVALLFSVIYAQAPRHRLGDMADELGLTDEQMENIKDAQYDFRKAEIGLRADLKTSRLELRHLMMQEKPDQKEITNLVDKIADTRKDLMKNNIDRKLAMKEILTREQFKKLIQMKAERREERMERGPRFRPHPPQKPVPQEEGPEF
jgi:Spy/CpxP family protein refolding chaperone